MRSRLSLTGSLAERPLFDRFWKRALIFGLPVAALAVLSVYPEKFRAEATLTPADPSSMGLQDTMGQLGALNSVFGKQADIEVTLRIGNSVYTRQKVIESLSLEKRLNKNNLEIHRWLEKHIDLRALRGGIILVQMDNSDPQLAQDIVTAYTEATRAELSSINLRQTEYKHEIIEKLVSQAADRLAKAQRTYDSFRLQNGYADPDLSIEVISEKVPKLRSALESVDLRIAAASRMFTNENITILTLLAERDALQAQLREALDSNPATQAGTVGEAVNLSSKLFELERELKLAQRLYTSYLQNLEGTTVEEVTATANMRLLEKPYVSTERQYRWPLLSGAVAFLLLWMAIEFYRLRPPLGAFRPRPSDQQPYNDEAQSAS